MRFQHRVNLLLGRTETYFAELDADVKVEGGEWSSPVRQRSGGGTVCP